MKNITAKNRHRGFSLMELIIAIAVFSLTMTTLVSTFVSVANVHKKVRMLQRDTENARFAMEQISKTLRTSKIISSSATNIKAFDYSQGSCVEYNFSNPKLQTGTGTWNNSDKPTETPDCSFSGNYADMIDKSLNSANFSVIKSVAAPVARTTISLHICYNNVCTGRVGDEVVIQSTVSSRDYQK